MAAEQPAFHLDRIQWRTHVTQTDLSRISACRKSGLHIIYAVAEVLMGEANRVFESFPSDQKKILSSHYIGPAIFAMAGADIQKRGHLTVIEANDAELPEFGIPSDAAPPMQQPSKTQTLEAEAVSAAETIFSMEKARSIFERGGTVLDFVDVVIGHIIKQAQGERDEAEVLINQKSLERLHQLYDATQEAGLA